MKKETRANICLLVIFLTIILFPSVNSLFHLFKDSKSAENRQSASMPEFNPGRLDPFPASYEKYFDDHFMLRSFLINQYNHLVIKYFNKSPIPDKLLIGRNGWFYMSGKEIEAYTSDNFLSNDDIDKILAELTYRQEYLRARNCSLYVLIAPTKASIYEEFLPVGISHKGNRTAGERFIEYCEKNSSVQFIDVFEILRQKKAEDQVYLKLDNHWNQAGALVVANKAFEIISHDFKEIEPLDPQSFNRHKKLVSKGNLVDMIPDSTNFRDTVVELVPRNGFRAREIQIAGYPCEPGFAYCWDYERVRATEGSDKPRILIISDSFGGELFPFISENFSRSVKIFDAWKYKLNENIIEQEQPDIVLYVILEAYIGNMLDNQSGKADINRGVSIK